MIFQETHLHVVELMTGQAPFYLMMNVTIYWLTLDPFGNYLCQKLLEYATDEQRTVLVNNAAPQLVKIALNQHGTRALQKMIEYLSTPQQVSECNLLEWRMSVKHLHRFKLLSMLSRPKLWSWSKTLMETMLSRSVWIVWRQRTHRWAQSILSCHLFN